MRRLLVYLLAVAATGAAVYGRLLLTPLLGDRLPFITLFGAVALAVWAGGFGPALLAAVSGYMAINRLILSAGGDLSMSPASPAGMAGLLAYALTCGLIIALGCGLRGARRRVEAAAQQVRDQRLRLEYEMAQHRQTEQALVQSEADLEMVADRTPVALTRLSADRRFLYVNRAAAALIGRPAADIVGRPIAEVMGEEATAAVAPYIERVLRGEVVEFEIEIPYPDVGRRFMHLMYTPDRDEGGRVSGWFASVHDITDRKAADAALEERERTFRALVAASNITEEKQADQVRSRSEERFRLLADAAPVLVWLSGPDKGGTWFNRPWLEFTGRTMEQEIGDGWVESVHPEDRGRCLAICTEAFASRRPFSMEFRLRRHDGAYRWVLDQAVPLTGPDGGFTGYIGSCIDITDRKGTEDALREGDRRKDEFLATLAHELRNPLAPVRNAVEVLRLKGSPTPEVQWAREVIDRQMRQMARIIDDLLDVSRITRDVLELRRERVDLATVLNAAIETSQGLIETSGHELDVHLPAHPIFLQGDVTRLAQVFANLLSNAAKFSEDGSRITLRAERRGNEVIVSVRDAGIGIPKEMQPRIFDMFVQVDRSLERSQGGLGIGLTLVRRLVELHGGGVEVRSEGPGKGSEFVVRLPIAAADTTAAAGPSAPRPRLARSAPARSRVLVADDNRDAAASLSTMLDIMGYETRTACDGAEAIKAADEFRPEVALLDIGMPKTNGYDVARQIRTREWGKDIVLMAVTGWGQIEDRQRTFEAGFDHHLVKPVDPDLLANLLANLTAKRHEA